MQKVIPHLWFDKEAKAAAEFYTSVFSNSQVTDVTTLHNTPSGDTDIVSFTVRGQQFMAISAGPYFKFNPSVSFMVNFDPSREKDAAENIDVAWEKLIEGGEVLMPIQEYPFSKRYGWLKDKYGLSWQLILTDPAGEERPEIIPSLLFVGDVYGKAEEAIQFYSSVFKEFKAGTIVKYGPGQEPNRADAVMFSDFKVLDLWMAAMDSALQHDFTFNEAVSFIVNCEDQEEIDYYWEKLSAVPEAEQCGWLKDKYGVSWQIVPKAMEEMMDKGTPEQIERITQAFLPMKKFNIAELQKAYAGK
jgi:predicted 3-demethylubiquinone-9 3-methyltransferase (glyoxalase superfamily)